jgi:hypothetical protein
MYRNPSQTIDTAIVLCYYLYQIMTARDLNPELRNVAYNGYLRKGVCPNTGDLSMRLSAARDSISLAGPAATTEASYYQTSDEVHRTFDRSLVDTEACLGGCALVSPGDQQVIPQFPEQ